MSYSSARVDDNQVLIERLPNNKGRIVRRCITRDSIRKDNYTEQRCLVCDKFLTEIKPENGTVIRIKCRGCLVVNEITYIIK